MIDPSKQYKTRDGRMITDLVIDHRHRVYPVVAQANGHEFRWTITGRYFKDNSHHHMDLIEVQPEKKMPQLDWNKPIQTRDGKFVVTLLSIHGRGIYPVIGYVGDNIDVDKWTAEGKFNNNNDGHPWDLVNAPEERTVYFNAYSSGKVYPYGSRDEADVKADSDKRIARVKVTYKVGQFDD